VSCAETESCYPLNGDVTRRPDADPTRSMSATRMLRRRPTAREHTRLEEHRCDAQFADVLVCHGVL
jgi:hypothetical protein